MRLLLIPALAALLVAPLVAQQPRARALGIPFSGSPGPLNAITDVAGVEVGQVTLNRGKGRLEVGKGPVRTGVTAILPRGKSSDPVMAAWFTLNGNGEMTGTTWVEESGFMWGPVMITNTLSVGVVRDAVLEWAITRKYDEFLWALPVVAETWDGGLNDIKGMHVTREHAFRALDSARSGPVAEGGVGGGTGMVCHSFKGGIGTASRRLSDEAGGHTVGVLVQCNYGGRQRLSIAGVPVGQSLKGAEQCLTLPDPSAAWLRKLPRCGSSTTGMGEGARPEMGSIIVVVATDAPLLPHQLKRLAKRVSLGIGRMGGIGGDSSGDIFIAFSTANPGASADTAVTVRMWPNEKINGLFEATIDATEEAIVNAMVAAETMTGADGYRVHALPTGQVVTLLKRAGRIK
ncbi:MAG: P1 family peptidase [Gemmatimonadota bacterium]|nr:P1 family peptidase [Gemmatimonadota bacterium]MDH4347576.1 P1 family peptidase [Gemmatimonadota bacterium]MDH5283077.1 P1 family peptidase [Gemmatimonadota bacterium]